MMKILLTGFEPFDDMTVNASWEAVKRVSCSFSDDISIEKLLLPVEYSKAADCCIEAIERFSPDAVIAVGLAAKRKALTLEYLAMNVMDSKMPDNAGKTMCNESIIDEGESVLYTNMPYVAAVSAILSLGLPAEVSFDAGTFVCNALFYRLLHYIQYSERKIYGGFLHVPPETVIESEKVAKAIETVLSVLL